MDPLSFAASLSALAGVAFQLVSYINSVREGGEERRKLCTQLTTLWMVLQQLQQQFASDLAQEDQSWTEKLQILQQPGGILTQINEALIKLQDKIQSTTGAYKIRQTLRWPLDKSDVDRAIQQIFQLHQLLNGVLTQANIALAQEIRKDGATVKSLIVGDDLKNFLDWLSPLNFLQRQQLIFKQTRTGTGKWFLDAEEYQSWEKEIGSIMWCPGIPGAGKSFMSSIVIEKLQELQKSQKAQNTIVLMVYFAFDDANSQSADLILGSLLKQTLQYRSAVPDQLHQDFRKHRNDGTRPSLEEITKCLISELAQFERIFIVMDGLDELLEEAKRRSLVEKVIGLSDKINLLVTSRPIENIRQIFGPPVSDVFCDGCETAFISPTSSSLLLQETKRNIEPHHAFYHCVDCDDSDGFDLCQSCYNKGVKAINEDHERHELAKRYCSLSIEIIAQDEDLQSYVEWRIENHDSLRRCVDKKIGLRDQILQRVIESAQGMFLLARFHMDSLVTKLTPRAVLKALETLPTGTDTTYELALQRINDMNPDFREKAKLFLIWVAYTYRPLNVREIEHATTLLAEDSELDTDEIIPAKVLASMCAGLVIIDEEENVRLCHYTVENYFQKVRKEVFVDSELHLANICLAYLMLDDFEMGPCADRDFGERSKKYSLLGYAASEWGRHVKAAGDEDVFDKAKLFLKSDPHRASCNQAFFHLDKLGYRSWDAKSDVTGLHLAAHFGLAQLVASLIKEGANVNAQDSLGTTALMYAAKEGHEAVVEELLSAGAATNIVCQRGGTALHRAVFGDYTGIVKRLLAQKELDVNALHTGWGFESSLMIAAMYGRVDSVRELLGRPDLRVNDLGTRTSALQLAVYYEHLEVIKLLLADPRTEVDLRDSTGSAALMIAAREGFVPIAEILLDKGANIEQTDSKLDGGGTPILRAIDYDNFEVVKLLYNRGASWDTKDKYNRSLIHGASVNNRSEILRWLLETQPGYDINLQDVNGKTALHDAAFLGYDECINVLLDFHARTDIQDKAGRTALRTAREHNNQQSYEILKKARMEHIESIRRTSTIMADIQIPITTAALTGDIKRVEAIVERAKTDPTIDIDERDDGLEYNAVAAAADGDHPNIVSLLIDAGANVNLQDRLGRTPLHVCARNNNPEIARLLIAAHADVNTVDQWGESTLSMAYGRNYEVLVVLLLEHGATINEKIVNVQTCLFWAAYTGNVAVVKRMLGMGAEQNRKDGRGYTALHYAKKGFHNEVAEFLIERENGELTG